MSRAGLVLWLVLAAAAGCGSKGAVTPAAVSFVFTNSTGRSIYIQSSGFTGQDYWSVLQGGQRLLVDNTCEVCDCSGCPSCAVCGRAIARVTEMMPGERQQWTWDGRTWQVVPNGCRPDLACERDVAVAAGAALDAHVTYSFTFAVDTTLGVDDQYIGAPLTASTTFTHPPAAPVEITATP